MNFMLVRARATLLQTHIKFQHLSTLRTRMRIERDGTTNMITYHPKDGEHSATVVLMHGLGDTSDGWADVAKAWAGQMPHVKFILPTAATRPVSLNGGMPMPAWYDIVGLTDRASESCEGIGSSVEIVQSILDKESSLGLPYSRLALAGFSQGGAMSLYCGLQLPSSSQKLAGLLVMSGYLPGASTFRLTEGLSDTPVLHCHGTGDPVVQHAWAQQTKSHLTTLGCTSYELKSFKNVPHTVTPEIIATATQFLQTILPFNASLALAPKRPADMSVKELKEAIRHAGLTASARGFTEKSEFVKLLEDHQR